MSKSPPGLVMVIRVFQGMANDLSYAPQNADNSA